MTEEFQRRMELLIINLTQRLRTKLINDEHATPGDRAALLESDFILSEIYNQRVTKGGLREDAD
jgi:hypothetical protein